MSKNEIKEVQILEAQKEIEEVKIEHTKTRSKWEEKLIHAYSMLAIKIGVILIALVIIFALFIR